MENAQVITVRGEEELAARAGHLFIDAQIEFICAAADMNTWSRPHTRAAISSRLRSSVSDGLVVRKLYSPVALAEEEQRLHLLAVAAVGAHVRICTATLPHETIIIDRKVMILASGPTFGDREFTVTTSPTMIDGVHALFQATWDSADELDVFLRRDVPHLHPNGRAILQALGSGLTDVVAARRMGISLRTYRRRVAELMTLLEAQSRFQAGVRAQQLGLTR